MAILCGTCAWADHHDFYPKRLRPMDRLAYYAEFFPLVEIDSSFYGIPRPDTVRVWRRQVPTEFVFNVKAFRTLTLHDRNQVSEQARAKDLEMFKAAVTVLAEQSQLGALLFQFPPWFVHNERHSDYIETLQHQFNDFPFAVEFRNRSWWHGEARARTLRWLSEMGAVNVVCDEPQIGTGTIPFVADVTNSHLVVFRLHGRNADTWYQTGLTSSQQRFDYLYTRPELETFLPVVERWQAESRDIHILMNNNQGNDAVVNAFDWQQLLGLERRPRPVLHQSKQLSLFANYDT